MTQLEEVVDLGASHHCYSQVTHHYVEIRREVQSLCVLTSWGRLVHLTRRPPPDMFPAILCPAWYGGTSVQLEAFSAKFWSRLWEQ